MSRSGVQLCTPATPDLVARLLARDGRVWVQPKYNGVHLRWDGRRLISSECNPVDGLPHVAEALARRAPGLALEGEAYCHGMDFQTIQATTCREKTLHPDYLKVGMVLFDLVGGREGQAARLACLPGLVVGSGPLSAAPADEARTPAEVDEILARWRAAGYEGVVVRSWDGWWQPGKHRNILKLKPGHEDAYRIAAVIEAAGQVRALVLEDSDGRRFKVGSFAVPAPERARLSAIRGNLPGRVCQVRYNHLTARGVPAGAVYTGLEA